MYHGFFRKKSPRKSIFLSRILTPLNLTKIDEIGEVYNPHKSVHRSPPAAPPMVFNIVEGTHTRIYRIYGNSIVRGY